MTPFADKHLLKELLCYALGGDVPERFLEHLLTHRHCWDAAFVAKLESLAYEFRPDLARWQLEVDARGYIQEQRLPLLDACDN